MKSLEKKYRAAYWKKYRSEIFPYKTKLCEICGKEFNPHGPQKRCNDCRQLVCQNCGNIFISNNSRKDQKYCSRECAYQIRKGIEPNHLKENRGKKPRTYHLNKRDKHGNAFDREWRIKVFERDSYTCQKCGKKGGRLQAHHIKPYKKHPKLRWDINNGETLCLECHKKTDSYGWKNYHKNHK